MMTLTTVKWRNRLSLFAACAILLISTTLSAQSIKPKDMWELGVHGGYLFVNGEVESEPGFGYGLHLRKALDYVFWVRADGVMGTANGKGRGGNDFWEYEMNWLTGTVMVGASLNNARLTNGQKRFDPYVMAGAGGSFYMTDFKTPGATGPRIGTVEREFAPVAVGGAGIGFRVNKRVNIALEHVVNFAFGQRADLIDGVNRENGIRSSYRDGVHYTSLRLNFNIGNAANKSEPLYWANLSDGMMKDVEALKKNQNTALADTDGDGVIDAVDQEPNTPADAPVDTKGRTLDSDTDGIPDYKDLEPFYPPRAGEQIDEDGVVINPITPVGGGGGVTEDRVQEMIDEALKNYGLSEPKGAVAEWFLPMIHFGVDSYRVKFSDYGTLSSVARMLKANPEMRLVITGYTDQTGPESYNEGLSYQRALAVADHLENQHRIGRGRMVLQWKGQDEALVPSAASYMNRRVEFRMATGTDYEMDPPTLGGSGGY
ncbi:MAG: OmpA family protein [Bacteroidota bacterium]